MFYVKVGCTTKRIEENDILYFHQNLHDTVIVTINETVYAKKTKVKNVFQLIQGNFHFCHNYLVINLDKIMEISKYYVKFEGDHSVYMCYESTLKLKKMLKDITL